MKISSIVIFQSLVFCNTVNSKRTSIDAILGKRYQFEMFENPEQCAQVYSKEAEITSQLKQFSNKLHILLENLRECQINSRYKSFFDLKRFMLVSI